MSTESGCFETSGDGRFSLRRDMTFHTVNEILDESKEQFAGHSAIFVDLNDVREADSAGLALLLEWLSWAQHDGREIAYENVPEQLLAIAEISEVAGLIAPGSRRGRRLVTDADQ